MSSSAALQAAIAAKLGATFTASIGDGVATVFTLDHAFGTKFLYVEVKRGATTLVNGTDYGVALTDDDHVTITALAGAPALHAWTVNLALLRLTVPIVSRRTKELGKEIEAAVTKRKLGIYVMPPLPQSFTQGNPFLFFDKVEIRVRIIEQPQINTTGADAYDLTDDVMACLHWQAFSTFLAVPLQLAARPVEMIEDPVTRIMDVIFEAVYGLQPATTNTP